MSGKRSSADRRHEWKRSKVSGLKRGTAAVAATDPTDLRTSMVTTADLATFQHQMRLEVADVTQQLRVEMTGTINSRFDTLSSISTALQNAAAKPVDPRPYRISDLIPSLAQNDSKRTIENSASNEGIRSMAHDREEVRPKEHVRPKFSICSTDQQQIRKRTEQRTWSGPMTSRGRSSMTQNKIENRFGTIRDEEKMLAVKKSVLESFFSYRLRGTTMSCSELLVAPENIIIDKVATVLTVRSRKADTSAPIKIGVAAKDDGESAREEEDQRIVDLALQAICKGTGR